jgi:WD40 repeat protein
MIVHSDTAFIVKDRSLHLESVAAGESKNIFYLGSIHKRKIIRVNEKGVIKDFTVSAQDGLCSVFGIKVDRASNVLWACSSPMAEMENFDSAATSGVYKYDIKSGKLLARFTPDEKKEYVFGDLTLAPDGKVFISDSKNNIIFTVNESTGKLDNYFNSKEFWNLQGLTFTDDGKYLFIADYIKGLFRLDTKDKTLIQLTQQFDISTKSIDGLTYYNNSLIGIQNSVYPMRVTQYILNPGKDQLFSYKIIDSAHPAFNEPTIGCLVKDTFYYVANSLWSGYSEKHELKPADQLQDVVILKASLKSLK